MIALKQEAHPIRTAFKTMNYFEENKRYLENNRHKKSPFTE